MSIATDTIKRLIAESDERLRELEHAQVFAHETVRRVEIARNTELRTVLGAVLKAEKEASA